jgi:hypothetical protein
MRVNAVGDARSRTTELILEAPSFLNSFRYVLI